VLWRAELYCIIVVCVCVCVRSVSSLWGTELVVGTLWGGECGAGDEPVWGCVVWGWGCLEVRDLDKVVMSFSSVRLNVLISSPAFV
jgi:hypothetical protein